MKIFEAIGKEFIRVLQGVFLGEILGGEVTNLWRWMCRVEQDGGYFHGSVAGVAG
jgi:hypothetical protein